MTCSAIATATSLPQNQSHRPSRKDSIENWILRHQFTNWTERLQECEADRKKMLLRFKNQLTWLLDLVVIDIWPPKGCPEVHPTIAWSHNDSPLHGISRCMQQIIPKWACIFIKAQSILLLLHFVVFFLGEVMHDPERWQALSLHMLQVISCISKTACLCHSTQYFGYVSSVPDLQNSFFLNFETALHVLRTLGPC